jgi:hypothetical protein
VSDGIEGGDEESGAILESIVHSNTFGSNCFYAIQLLQHVRAWKLARYCEGDFFVIVQDDFFMAVNAREKLDQWHSLIQDHLKEHDVLGLSNGKATFQQVA